jgi:hypothetical protein
VCAQVDNVQVLYQSKSVSTSPISLFKTKQLISKSTAQTNDSIFFIVEWLLKGVDNHSPTCQM